MTLPRLLLASLLFTACATEMTDAPLRGPIGKADLVGSCSPDDCGGPAVGGACYCDDECVTYGDCCADKADACDAAPAQICGTRGVPPCGEGEYCHFEADADCGKSDRPGVCMPTPEACAEVFMPVCGCDGETTYGNACDAHAAGDSVSKDGECHGNPPPLGTSCGGFAGLVCPESQYCAYDAAEMCGAADQMGTCSVKPEICIQLFAPVCGCDGVTYSNSCFAAAAGASVISSGACGAPAPLQCGGFANLQCPSGMACTDDPADSCDPTSGGADCGGICVAS